MEPKVEDGETAGAEPGVSSDTADDIKTDQCRGYYRYITNRERVKRRPKCG